METLKEAFNSKYTGNDKIIGYFEEANGVECTWENLSKIRLQRYVTYLATKVSKNSAKIYCAKLKSVLTSYNEEVSLPRDYEKVLQVRADASQHIYLNDEEIRTLINYQTGSRSETIIKNRFLIGCLTGARHSDYINFTSSNIRDNELHYVSIKTHTDTTVPLSPYVARLIRENEENGYNSVNFSDSYFNRALRRICCNTGINSVVSLYTGGRQIEAPKWKFIASHCARRSFATNLYRHGVDIYTISRLCGHSSVEMTKKYICCAPNVSDATLDYLNSYE